MKIELEEPYKSLYRYGYLDIDPRSGRKQVKLTRNDGTGTTTAYARYLMSVELGHLVPEGYDVDHINEDHTDDSRSNLQILTEEAHREKSIKYKRENVYKFKTLNCSGCGIEFTITEGTFNRRNAGRLKPTDNYFCTPECATKTLHTMDDECDQRIRELDSPNINSSEIARELGLSVSTVIRNRQNHPKNGLGVKISEEIIEKINSFDPNKYSVLDIARELGIGKNSVVKYKTTVTTEGLGRSIPKNVFPLIDDLAKQSKSNAEIARTVNVDASTVSRYLKSKRG